MKYRYSTILFLCCTLSSLYGLHAQKKKRDNLGKEFYVSFAPNLGTDEPDNQSNKMTIFIASAFTAHGHVDVPALDFHRTFVTTPGRIYTLELPDGRNGASTVEVTDEEVVVPGMGVHITADSDVAVYGLNHKLFSTDAFMGLPVGVLGTEYRAMCFNGSSFGGETPAEFWLTGVEDSTNVRIIPTAVTAQSVPAGNAITVVLNAGDVFLVQGIAGDQSNDLTGSLIESDRPIAAFSGHKRTQMPMDALNDQGSSSRNHLCEQLPPTSAWGDSTFVIPFTGNDEPDLVRVLCSEDGTAITVNGVPVPGIFNAGQFYQIDQLSDVADIRATKPILVGQYMHTSKYDEHFHEHSSLGDPCLAFVFPVEQFDTSYTIVSIEDPAAFSANYINIVVSEAGISTMQIDGMSVAPTEFLPIFSSGYSYAKHPIEQGTHHLTCQKPFGITIYGLGPADGYAYTGGTLLKTITPLVTQSLAIDFGDRVLIPTLVAGNTVLSGKFDTTVFLKNISEDTVNIYAFPRRTQDTGKFHVTRPGVPPVFTLKPNALDSMTIEFEPLEANRRMHTQVTASTDHLRAYVVDVFGRGVLNDMGVFSDSNKIQSVRVIDFGLFANTDPPADTIVYIGNAGLAKLSVDGINITGTNQTDFNLGQPLLLGSPTGIPFTIPAAPSSPASVHVKFIPSGPNGPRTATLTVLNTDGKSLIVILKARIETLVPLSLPPSFAFDTTLVCKEANANIDLVNPNDVDVTLIDANISGANAGDYTIAAKVPLTIPAHQTVTLPIKFVPFETGTLGATITLTYDRPKGTVVKATLRGIAFKAPLSFTSPLDFAVRGEETFLFPIDLLSDVTPYNAGGYTIHLSYDSTILELQDVSTTGTLFENGWVVITGSRGQDTVAFTSLNNIPLAGGGRDTARPIIFLKFRSHLDGLDKGTFHAKLKISYTIELTNSNVLPACLEHINRDGFIEILTTCSDPHVEASNTPPTESYMEQNNPNPFNPSTDIHFGVSHDGNVRIDLLNPQGVLVRTLLNEVRKPGNYSVTLNGDNLSSGTYFVRFVTDDAHKLRKLILLK